MVSALKPYDAVVLISFGGPEAPEEVNPFLHRVTAGRGVPQARLDEVAEHYLARGGVSPINAETRTLAQALRIELARRGVAVPLEVGNRNSAPFLTDTLRRLVAGGARRILSLTTSAYPSYSSCRQYLDDVAAARADLAGGEAPEGAVVVDKIRHYAHHPGFVAANVAAVTSVLGEPSTRPPHVVFVTHSLPLTLAETSGPPPWAAPSAYVQWHRTLAHQITEQTSRATGQALEWSLAYCSRSGPPHQSWLEPDVNDLLTELHRQGVEEVILAPIGFTSDHMEVVWDLDEEAAPHGRALGLTVRRAETARAHPAFVSGLVDLLFERAAVTRGEQVESAVIAHGDPGWAVCRSDCCPRPIRPGRF